jgi:iron complex transport system permease protein
MTPAGDDGRAGTLDRSIVRERLAWVAGLVFLLAAALLGVTVGAVALPPLDVLGALLDRIPGIAVPSGLSEVERNVLLELRLPRVALAAVVGGTLAVAGAGYQGVFRNPLVDPYLLGAAAGAGVGATIVIATRPAAGFTGIAGGLALPAAAFLGALLGVAMAYGLGTAASRGGGTIALVLAGVAVTAFLTSVQTFIQQSFSESLREVYSWILGQLSVAGWGDVLTVLPYAAVSWAVLLTHAHLLDLMSVGDEEATSLGVRAGRVRLIVLLGASLGTAAAVAISGLIGFVGLIVPHMVRLLVGTSYRVVLPLSLLGGGAFLVVADVIARTVLAPAELPIGVITAFVGGPFFALLLWMARGERV